jgi:hypothetical protein
MREAVTVLPRRRRVTRELLPAGEVGMQGTRVTVAGQLRTGRPSGTPLQAREARMADRGAEEQCQEQRRSDETPWHDPIAARAASHKL